MKPARENGTPRPLPCLSCGTQATYLHHHRWYCEPDYWTARGLVRKYNAYPLETL